MVPRWLLKLDVISNIILNTLPLGSLGFNKFQGWALVALLELIHESSIGTFTVI